MKSRFLEYSSTRLALYMGSAFLGVCLVATLGFFFVQDMTRWGTFPPGSKVCGVNVSGLSKAGAVKKCETELAVVANKPVTLTLDGETYTATPDELGLRMDYQKMVDTAYAKAWAPNVAERMFRSFVNRPKTVNGLIAVQNNDELVNQFVQRVTDTVNQPPRNAYIDVTNATPVIVKARDGYEVAASEIKQEVAKAVNSTTRTVPILAKRNLAAIKDDSFHKFIIVNLEDHVLTYYDRDKVLAQYGVANGQAAFPSPPGQWRVVDKQMNPTWYNPHDGWSATMPETIGPGYSNPLGLRAMALDASGVLIHGTSNDGSIGTAASHGCIRMHMPEVIALFDIVDVGTPVYLVKAPGNPGFDVTDTPAWRLKDSAVQAPSKMTGD